MTDDLIERLRALSRHEHSDYSIGDEAAAALEAAREDAERYRWLRDREIPEWLDLWHQNPDRIDAAIDAAIDRERGKGER